MPFHMNFLDKYRQVTRYRSYEQALRHRHCGIGSGIHKVSPYRCFFKWTHSFNSQNS